MHGVFVEMAVIDQFEGEYAFLSNFWPWDGTRLVGPPCPVKLYGIEYPSVEHAFQAAKTLDLTHRETIRLAATPGKAKRLGRRVRLRHDLNWDDNKVEFMEKLLRRKFDHGSDLWFKLRATSPAELIEGNDWGDDFWGAVPVFPKLIDHRWVGLNHLGKLLVKIRDEVS